MSTYITLEAAKAAAAELAAYAKAHKDPTAFEVVKTAKGLDVQPFGMHTLFKSQKLLHVEPIPKD